MTSAVTTKSGKGLSYGVVSELATYWNVLPGHEDELRAATQRFAGVLSKVPPEKNIHTGLRDSRHVIFDNGTRLMWATTFENDWDPYFDDFVMIGIEHFLDWMQHTAQYTDVSAWVESSGGAGKFHRDNPKLEAQMKQTVGGLKAIVQSVQSPGQVRLHRMIRRGTNYGPSLPPGVLDDDGADRGLMFAFVGARLARQFEFVQQQWVNDGKFIGAPAERDPLIGVQDGGEFTIPKRPIRRRLHGLPNFVVNRGGEYRFMPGLRALRWLTDLDT